MNFSLNKKISVGFSVLALVFLLFFYFFFLAQKINLITVDLGRHLKNGENILLRNFAVLSKNFYSYTYPDYHFINHHWGSGLIFFLIFKLGNFIGLHLFFIFLNLITFLIFFLAAKQESDFKIAFVLSFLLIPLIAERKELRPEVFSYFFSAVFFCLLLLYQKNQLKQRYLFLLPLAQIIWVNTHIYFFLGLFLILVFLLEDLLKKDFLKAKNLLLIFCLSLIMSFFNPFGAKGVFYPFNIFKDYGYRVAENQSVWFLENYGLKNPNFFLFKISLIILWLSFICLAVLSRRKLSFANLMLATGFSVMALLALRNFTLFGFFALPLTAANIKNSLAKWLTEKKQHRLTARLVAIIIFLIILIMFIPTYRHYWFSKNYAFGLGLAPGISEATNFLKKENVKGPIFNNYDIGSYLIYYLYPQEKVFVDNRPEAYPVDFFQNIYIPMQDNEMKWRQQDDLYHFNAIIFSYRDLTPWAQKFLIERVKDSQWAPVFAGQYVIIFLKRNDLNQAIIEKYEIPKTQFIITKA